MVQNVHFGADTLMLYKEVNFKEDFFTQIFKTTFSNKNINIKIQSIYKFCKILGPLIAQMNVWVSAERTAKSAHFSLTLTHFSLTPRHTSPWPLTHIRLKTAKIIRMRFKKKSVIIMSEDQMLELFSRI